MKCPHCLTEIHSNEQTYSLGPDHDGWWTVLKQTCPACKRMILALQRAKIISLPQRGYSCGETVSTTLFRPKCAQRPPPPPEVPRELAEDYTEACLVLPDSPKASAALSRRCLQHLLRDTVKVKPSDLSKEIQELLDSGKLPSHIAESIDAIRNIGNFAAHPIKSTTTGEIVEVEAGEAEWTLDVLESLFDFYFVQPALLKKKKDALNQKLQSAGKKTIK